MNDLVKMLRENNFPGIFRYEDILKFNFGEKNSKIMFDEALKNKWIDILYKGIYTLKEKDRRMPVSVGALAQMIEPDSYLSLYYVLCEYSWIPEYIFSATNVTLNKSFNVEVDKYGTFIYVKLYENISPKGIYEENNIMGNYKRAKPLRALCDLIYYKNRNILDLDSLYEGLRVDSSVLEEDLKSVDFEEIQGSFGIIQIERFLENIRKELGL